MPFQTFKNPYIVHSFKHTKISLKEDDSFGVRIFFALYSKKVCTHVYCTPKHY